MADHLNPTVDRFIRIAQRPVGEPTHGSPGYHRRGRWRAAALRQSGWAAGCRAGKCAEAKTAAATTAGLQTGKERRTAKTASVAAASLRLPAPQSASRQDHQPHSLRSSAFRQHIPAWFYPVPRGQVYLFRPNRLPEVNP